MTLKKLILTTLSVLLIAGGWFLEVYWYKDGFMRFGNGLKISITMGIALTILLTSLFIKDIFNGVWKIIARTVLLCFSVFITFNGQSANYSEKSKTNSIKTATEENKRELYDYYTDTIQELKATIQQKDALLPKDVNKRTYINTNGVQPLLKEIEGYNEKLTKYETKLELLIPTLSTSKTVENVNKSAYELLASDLGLKSPTLLQLVSQAILSLLIAILAPSGTVILSTVYAQPKEKKKVVKKESRVVEETTDIITLYANGRYGNSEKPKTLKSRKFVCESLNISYNNFNKITKRAVQLGLIAVHGSKSVPMVSRSQFIMMIRNKKDSVKEIRG